MHTYSRWLPSILTVSFILGAGALAGYAAEDRADVPQQIYRGGLIAFPGPWAFDLGRSAIILVSDEELEALGDPDRVLDLSLTFDKHEASLRQVCERAQAAGHVTLVIAFDHFFRQYRPGQDAPRRLTPDMPEYIAHIAKVGQFAQQYGLGLELSLLSPLEIGPAYRARTGHGGRWLHYRKGLRDPDSGAYSVQLWRQRRWANNKGVIDVQDAGVRVFAFRESGVPGSPRYRAVNPADIVDISDTARVEVWEGMRSGAGRDYEAVRIRVSGAGRTDIGRLDRVLVVQQYDTPEMDYFSEDALPFLEGLVDAYADAGIQLNGLYSDEMHIQQDWGYFNHHDHSEFALRYVSAGLADAFARRYGEQYRDLAKYMIYFTHGQEDFANDLSAKEDVMHVFGGAPEQIRETALFRARYYHLLQDGVVDLFAAAKRHAERRMGRRLEARAHATWAQSPTIDKWNAPGAPHAPNQYEYTSNFVWSNTVHQAASACYDYFKWGDFLTGGGNDHTEGGWLDRNYYGCALACSTGILNETPYSYAAHWGMPAAVHHWRSDIAGVYGAAGPPGLTLVEDMQHRDVDVLMLYPIDLVAVDERFGSWMTQYGYANLVTADKLLERGQVRNGVVEMAGRRFTTLMALYEPFPAADLLSFMRGFAESGGRLIWSGPPPVLTREGQNALAAWQEIFGVTYAPPAEEGFMAPGKRVEFSGALQTVPPQTILTDFTVDRIFPIEPGANAEPVARVKGKVVGTRRAVGTGTATFLGFRPRDDQSQSLGYDERTLFNILDALGAYPPAGAFPGYNDNTEYLSRTGDVLCCRFPNGTLAFTPHLRTFEEGWPGGFARDREKDEAYLAQRPLPSNRLSLAGFRVNGHTVDYEGDGAMAFRLDSSGNLIAFSGSGASSITVDGRTFSYSSQPGMRLAWAPVPEARRVEGGAVLQIIVYTPGPVRIPLTGLPAPLRLIAQGATPGSAGQDVPSQIEEGHLVFDAAPGILGRWLYAVAAPNP